MYLCSYHNSDLDELGHQHKHPEIACQACRAMNIFSEDKLKAYKDENYCLYAEFRSKELGNPETAKVIFGEFIDDDRIERIQRFLLTTYGRNFEFRSVSYDNPHHGSYQTIVGFKELQAYDSIFKIM